MEEQAAVQMTMTLYRFSAFIVMFVTLLVGLCKLIAGFKLMPLAYPNPFVDEANPTTDTPHIAFTTLFNFDGFSELFTTSAVALNFHFTLPGMH